MKRIEWAQSSMILLCQVLLGQGLPPLVIRKAAVHVKSLKYVILPFQELWLSQALPCTVTDSRCCCAVHSSAALLRNSSVLTGVRKATVGKLHSLERDIHQQARGATRATFLLAAILNFQATAALALWTVPCVFSLRIGSIGARITT